MTLANSFSQLWLYCGSVEHENKSEREEHMQKIASSAEEITQMKKEYVILEDLNKTNVSITLFQFKKERKSPKKYKQ